MRQVNPRASLPAHQYNYIYSRLVSAPDDIIGIIAYARYKQQKIEWVADFKARNGDKNPDNNDLSPFHSLTNTETAIQGYRLQAKEILDEYLSRAIEQASNDIAESYEEMLNNELRNVEARYTSATQDLLEKFKSSTLTEIKASKPGMISGIFQNVMANIIIVIITALILLVMWSMKQGFFQVLGDVTGYDVKAKPEISEPK